MSSTTILGVAATLVGIVMGLSPLLQLRTIVERRSSDDISIPFFTVLLVGFVLWLSYGIALGNLALIVSNAVAFTTYSITMVAVVRYRKR